MHQSSEVCFYFPMEHKEHGDRGAQFQKDDSTNSMIARDCATRVKQTTSHGNNST